VRSSLSEDSYFSDGTFGGNSGAVAPGTEGQGLWDDQASYTRNSFGAIFSVSNSWCWRCGEPGHKARFCPNTSADSADGTHAGMSRDDLAGQSGAPRPVEACFRCGQFGHFFRDCGRNGAIPSRQACFKCGQLGHQSRNCTGQDLRTCFSCKQTGHVAKDCLQAREQNT